MSNNNNKDAFDAQLSAEIALREAGCLREPGPDDFTQLSGGRDTAEATTNDDTKTWIERAIEKQERDSLVCCPNCKTQFKNPIFEEYAGDK